ncbi:MAG: 3-hydroxybutyryl-CoA dehydrogenase [Dermatophilus congolensis]|nr:3-hydroxybutyryl-CoA dehydrogenase [Dermatophilus congolensis]
MFQRVGVVGCGLMGSGIAQVCAQAELDVVVVEANPQVAEAGRARLEKSLAKAEERGKVDSADAVLDRIEVVSDIHRLHDREIVIEAIAEVAAAKTELFKRLDGIVEAKDAILASNTSSIPISTIAAATKRPENVMGVHFFNPVPVLSLVELVPSLLTSSETVERARAFAADQLGKHPITAPDRSGFVVNALLVPFVLSAIRMLEQGVATAEDIDEGLVRGAAHPQGPLALADLIGLDTMVSIAESLYEEFKEPTYAPPPLLRRMVEAGLLGRKSGRGFYQY